MDGFLEKQSAEEFDISINFNSNLYEFETITSADVKAYLNSTVFTDDIIDSFALADKIVYIKLNAGQVGRKYKITTLINTSNGNKFESDIELKIVNE